MKIAVKREQSQTCLSFAEREQFARVSRKIAVKREQSQTCLSFAEREQFARVSRKIAVKREQSQTCLSFAEREQFARVSRKIAVKREQSQTCLSFAEVSILRAAKKWVYLALLLPALLISCGKDDDNAPEPEEDEINWNDAADQSSMALANLFWNTKEKWFNDDSNGKADWNYWPQAHALDVLTDAWLRSNDNTYKAYFDQWYEGVKARNGNTFENDFYDDMEWNALAILRVWQATNDPKFKDAALQLWEYIKTGWNDNAGGGICWKKGQEYSKNACSNGPACILAARLYREFGDESNKEWALKIYNWEKSTLFNSNNGMVYDNINSETGETKTDWIFTYNQGTFIGSAVELYKIFNEKAYLNDAVLAADYTTSSLTSNSVLKSEGTGDGGLFKGIFIRYFTDLIRQDRLDASARKRYIQFISYNAETLWTQGTSKPAVLYGPDWTVKPGSVTGLTEQLSGCMLIEATALLNKEGLLE